MKSKAPASQPKPLTLLGKRILLGVTGSIAAYKAVGLVRTLTTEGADVTVAMTQSATRFVTPLTFEVLSKQPVAIDLFAGGHEMPHLSLSARADAVLVAPATANMLAKCALGLADDLLSAIVLNTRCPLIFAPAMDADMWDHPAVQANVEALRKRGAVVLEPEVGPLASGAVAKGRLPKEAVILAALKEHLARELDWAGQRVLLSAGPTQEAIDPVRFISNRSSGKMGFALAEAARDRGAEVVLVSGPTALPAPPAVTVVPVETAQQMQTELLRRLPWATVVIMAAAVADFRPKRPAADKLKKLRHDWHELELEPTDDILTRLAERRTNQVLVGFAAETGTIVAQAREKLRRKGVDLMVGNNVAAEGSGFGSDTNAAVLVDRHGIIADLAVMPKRQLADRILDAVLSLESPAPGQKLGRR